MADEKDRKDEAENADEKAMGHLRLVSENAAAPKPVTPEADPRREYRYVEMWLEQLAANIIRMVRGAGKPQDIAFVANKFMTAFFEYQDKFGEPPSPDRFAESLRLEWPDYETESEGAARRRYILEKTVKASMQIAACQVAGHDALERKSTTELWDLFDSYHRMCVERAELFRQKQRDEAKLAREAAKPATRKKARKPPAPRAFKL